MTKKLILFFTLILTALSLISCSGTDVPEGMQLVNGGEEKGYYFYAPEEWTVANLGDIDAAYVSNLDNSSISFYEVDSSGFNSESNITKEAYFFEHYFEDNKNQFPDDMKMTAEPTECSFGSGETKADRAMRYVYEYTYQTFPFRFMQILAMHDGHFYIFTYSAQLTEKVKDEGVTRYDYFMDKISEVITNFKFIEKKESNSQANEYPTVDGYILATDKTLSGFDFYVPEDFKVDFSSTVVSATRADGSNVTMTRATRIGVTAETYWNERLSELSEIVDDVKVIRSLEPTSLGNNSQWAFLCEYTYVYNGESFRVYQILAVDGGMFTAEGYVFTYTAKEENYEKHITDVKDIIDKVRF